MKIFKFGGASVKDAESVKNVAVVLESQGFEKCLLVVSAMGKTTNALEKVVEYYFAKELRALTYLKYPLDQSLSCPISRMSFS